MDSICKQYPGIFKSVDETSGNGNDQITPFVQNYGWLILVDRVAGGNKMKWNDVFRIPAREFLNIIVFSNMQREQEQFEMDNHRRMV
jgi:hypothetical protein